MLNHRYTIFTQGRQGSQAQAVKYLGGNAMRTTTNETIMYRYAGVNTIDRAYLWVYPELKEVNKQPHLVSTVPVRYKQKWHRGIQRDKFSTVPSTLYPTDEPGSTLYYSIDNSEASLGQQTDIDALHKRYIKLREKTQDPYILYGVSRGAATSFIFPAIHPECKPNLCILEAPPATITSVLKVYRIKWLYKLIAYFFLGKKHSLDKKYHAMGYVDKFPDDLPIMIISSKVDEVVPHKSSLNLALRVAAKRKSNPNAAPVYFLQLDNPKHSGYVKHPVDSARYQNTVHAIYQAHAFEYKKEMANLGAEELIIANLNSGPLSQQISYQAEYKRANTIEREAIRTKALNSLKDTLLKTQLTLEQEHRLLSICYEMPLFAKNKNWFSHETHAQRHINQLKNWREVSMNDLEYLIQHSTIQSGYISQLKSPLLLDEGSEMTERQQLALYLSKLSKLKNLQQKIELVKHLYHLSPIEYSFGDARSLQQFIKNLPLIQRTSAGRYQSPEDVDFHTHRTEAKRIFYSTQWERFKSLLHHLFAKIGIYVFESAPYYEASNDETYAKDQPIDIDNPQKATHYWVGHATNLLAIPTTSKPMRILTDPIEGDLNHIFYPRMTAPGKTVHGKADNMLPKIDVIIISHNHRDHVDVSTLKKLVAQQPLMIVPKGDEKLFHQMGFHHIQALEWWEQISILKNGESQATVTAVPCKHWSCRGLHDANCSCFNGYVIQSPRLTGDIYFAGDTAIMRDDISSPIFKHFNITTSIQPGGPDENRDDMQSTHQSSADAILMHFKIIQANYKKNPREKDIFLHDIQSVKTLYNHTATYKLGNLRQKDSFYSLVRIKSYFANPSYPASMPKHERFVIDQIRIIADDLNLTNHEVLTIIENGITIPKIGQRHTLGQTISNRFDHRDLIRNKRVLKECEAFCSKNRATTPDEQIKGLLKSYKAPWHARFTRSQHYSNSFFKEIETSDIDALDINTPTKNPEGHLAGMIHYSRHIRQSS